MVTLPKRKGRFELWLGGGCVLLVCLAALIGSYRKEIQVGYLFWRFNNGADEAESGQIIRKMLMLGKPAEPSLRRMLVADARELQVLRDTGLYVTACNNRPHRVILRCWQPVEAIMVHSRVWTNEERAALSFDMRVTGEAYPSIDPIDCDFTRREYDPSRGLSGLEHPDVFAIVVEPRETVHVMVQKRRRTYPLCYEQICVGPP